MRGARTSPDVQRGVLRRLPRPYRSEGRRPTNRWERPPLTWRTAAETNAMGRGTCESARRYCRRLAGRRPRACLAPAGGDVSARPGQASRPMSPSCRGWTHSFVAVLPPAVRGTLRPAPQLGWRRCRWVGSGANTHWRSGGCRLLRPPERWIEGSPPSTGRDRVLRPSRRGFIRWRLAFSCRWARASRATSKSGIPDRHSRCGLRFCGGRALAPPRDDAAWC